MALDPRSDWRARKTRVGTDFFHYRRISGQRGSATHLDEVLHTLESGEVYFTPPSAFTDPFDCNPVFDFDDLPPEDLDARLQELSQSTDIPVDVLAQRLRQPNALDDPKLQTALNEQNRRISQSFGIFCLAQKPTVPLMWTHYAEGHTGICLRFQFTADQEPAPFSVEYSDQRTCRLTDTPWEIAARSVLGKSSCWAYEEEYRCIRSSDQGGPGWAPMPHLPVTGLVLGYRFPRVLRKPFLRRVRAVRGSLPVFEAVLHPTQYQLDLVPVVDG